MSAPQHLLISEEALESVSSNGSREIPYTVVDEGDLAVIDVAGDRAAAVLINDDGPEPSDLAPADAELLLKVTRTAATDRLAAYRLEGGWHPIDVTVVPRVPDVFDRIRGVFESDKLRHKSVLILGLGSGGSFVCRELVRAGVGRFTLIDHDRLDTSNVFRPVTSSASTISGASRSTRCGTTSLQRNPLATVSTHSFRLDGTTFDALLDLCEQSPDLIICGTDNRESRLLINRASVLHSIVTLYGGVRRRAYAGQVLESDPRADALLPVLHQGSS